MLSLRNILLTLAVFSAVPLSLAAPTAQDDSLAQYNPVEAREADIAAPYESRDVETEDFEEEDIDDGEEVISRLMARTTCGITSKRGKTCQQSQCPPAAQCKVSPRGRCVFKNAKKDRPFGCSQCKCYKLSS
ncbi:hypothetical protein GQ44DRAFT_697736 [Phaeosphaeriaceae sp. PMI808]|nr:hypothetical protein GQ44DRAFT_697736 [Phaeosphaeriaceae sp. PMI808]